MDALFEVHKLNEEGMKRAQAIAVAFDTLILTLEDCCPKSGREYAIVRTKLEEACFYAKKAMANQPLYQQQV